MNREYKNKRVKFSTTIPVYVELEAKCKELGISKSEFINRFLRVVLFNDIAYAKMMCKQCQAESNYWEYEVKQALLRKDKKKEELKKWI